jgi:hypothetical protein
VDYDFRVDLVTVYGFDFKLAAEDLGVSLRTINRWYEGYPSPIAKRLVAIMARGYLPDYPPFDYWRIVGKDIYTPWGNFPASEVEYLRRYQWNARELAARFRVREQRLGELMKQLDSILERSDEMRTIIQRMYGN